MGLHEVVEVDEDISIQAFYAGHVLGAAMFLVKVGDQSVLYTGDFNMTPDRHLGAAHVFAGLKPDLLITETTYASTIRDSKRARERDFLQKISDTVFDGGKVGLNEWFVVEDGEEIILQNGKRKEISFEG